MGGAPVYHAVGGSDEGQFCNVCSPDTSTPGVGAFTSASGARYARSRKRSFRGWGLFLTQGRLALHAHQPWRLPLVALIVLLATLLGASSAGGMPSAGPPPNAAPAPLLGSAPPGPSLPAATPGAPAGGARGAERAGQSPTLLGDINNDGIVDIRDYGVWRQQFGATNCGNPADLDGDCIVDIRDYGVWRQQFGQTGPTVTPTPTATATATPTATPLPGRAYVA